MQTQTQGVHNAGIGSFLGILVGGAAIVFCARMLGLEELIRNGIAAGHLLDWIMGALSFIWLLIILKAPWDLYFEAHRVAFEQQRSRDRGIAIVSGREAYVRLTRRRLGILAVSLHIFSAALVAGVALLTHDGAAGYYFAGFFLVSTLFRPLTAGYGFMIAKLREVGSETRYPRDDIAKVLAMLGEHKSELAELKSTADTRETYVNAQLEAKETDLRDLRQRQIALSREFESTVSRLTDNREVIQGIQAFVRLVSQSASAS